MKRAELRIWHVLAGLTGIGVTAVRAVLGGLNEYTHIATEIAEPKVAATLMVGWHALSAVFLIAAVALLIGARVERAVARMSGLVAMAIYGSTALLFLVVGALTLGSAFAMFQWLPLGAAAALALVAALRA